MTSKTSEDLGKEAEAEKFADILDVAHRLMTGTKKLEVRKTYDFHDHQPNLLVGEKTTYQIVDVA